MISGIRKFFSLLIEPELGKPGPGGEHALQLATAALLMEMIRMDSDIDTGERAVVKDALRRQFGLDETELDRMLVLADAEARDANGYHQFTSLINQCCSPAEKMQIVEYLWRVALSDGRLDAHELHLMRKLTDLLHISHADNIAAKQRAREFAKGDSA